MSKHEQLIITKYDLLFESRLSKVEATMENINDNLSAIKIDFRWLFGLMITGFAGMFAIMAHGFHWY